jgi:hypothetical protein
MEWLPLPAMGIAANAFDLFNQRKINQIDHTTDCISAHGKNSFGQRAISNPLD